MTAVVLNYTEIIIASIISFIIGSLWYSPIGFGEAWRKSKGVTEEKIKDLMEKGEFNIARTMLLELLTRVIRSYVYAVVLLYYSPIHLYDYLYMSLLLCFGFSVTENLGSYLWDMMPFNFFLINAGEVIVSSSVTAVIFYLI